MCHKCHHKIRDAVLRLLFCGATGNRTRDTRIFSPLLYQLSYDTRNICFKCGCKDTHFFKFGKFLRTKKFISRKKRLPLHRQMTGIRNVAQLVAHYVRDVGVGRSSRLIPTEKGATSAPFSVGMTDVFLFQLEVYGDGVFYSDGLAALITGLPVGHLGDNAQGLFVQ